MNWLWVYNHERPNMALGGYYAETGAWHKPYDPYFECPKNGGLPQHRCSGGLPDRFETGQSIGYHHGYHWQYAVLPNQQRTWF